MRNYFILTGFLMGLAIGSILVGQQLVTAYENAINSEVRAKLIQGRLDQIDVSKGSVSPEISMPNSLK
ncbi:MAG: hypothetical protein M1155_01835 [Patescibacteria group bacterium]|nr:hypothetical protein [Patescibacteria group bacterium]